MLLRDEVRGMRPTLCVARSDGGFISVEAEDEERRTDSRSAYDVGDVTRMSSSTYC